MNTGMNILFELRLVGNLQGAPIPVTKSEKL